MLRLLSVHKKKHRLKLLEKKCLRKSAVSVERISVCNAIESLAEHGIHCLPGFYTKEVIDMLP